MDTFTDHRKLSLITGIIALCAVLFSTSIAHSAVINVPGDYATIQEGVNAAVIGDTLIVGPGTYVETVVLKDNVTLMGLGFPIIGSSLIGSLSAASNCTINGFKIHGLSISTKNNVTVRNCVLYGKDNVLASATIANSQDILIEYSTFSDGYYGGITGRRVDILNSQNITLKNNIILTTNADVSTDITAIYLDTVSGASIINNVISATSGNLGTGVYLANMTGANAVQNNIISGTTYSIDGDTAGVTISHNDMPEGAHHVRSNIALGHNNISVDPDFVDTISYRLKPSSPCIEAGIIQAGNKTDIGVYTNLSTAPIADFTGYPLSGVAPLTVQFIDQSFKEGSSITSWLWEFRPRKWISNGCYGFWQYYRSIDQNPVHIYDAVGTYTVKLTVTGPDGSAVKEKIGYITVTDSASASAPAGAPAGATSSSTTSSSAPAGGGAVQDTTPPVIAITSPQDKTGVDTGIVTVQGTVSDEDLARVEISVNGTYEGDAAISAGNFSLNVGIPTGGTLATIEAKAIDGSGNQAIASINVIKGYMLFVELPRYYKINENTLNLSSIAVAQDMLDHMRPDSYGMPTADGIYNHGHPLNLPENDLLIELDAQGIKAALGKFDIYDGDITSTGDFGDSVLGYNFDIYSMADTPQGYTDYLKEIIRHIAWPVTTGDYTISNGSDVLSTPYTPVAIPIYADTLGYAKWVVVNGFASDISPYKYNAEPWKYPLNTTNVTIYGFFLTDPDPLGIGESIYVPFLSLPDYLKPLSSIDSYNTKYIMVADPPRD